MLTLTAFDLDRLALAPRRAVQWLVRTIAAIRRDRANRQTYRRMLHMGDHQLRDIGLTREDLYHVLSQPPTWDDL